jgi:hypothetical protein
MFGKRSDNRIWVLALLVLLLALTVTACGGGEKATAPAAEQPAEVTQAPTIPPVFTNTPIPTQTPAPTNTPRPTATPKPTNTPEPTETPTPVPEPVTLTGTGDYVVDSGWPCDPALVHVAGNAGGRYFAVESYDANNELVDLLVNVTEPYEGYQPLNWRTGECAVRFQVKAIGDWTIRILPIVPGIHEVAERWIEVPGTREGEGDDVIFLRGKPSTATISGNEGARYFAVVAWGDWADLVVNTTDPYKGTVMLDKSTVALEIKATGAWSVEVTGQ